MRPGLGGILTRDLEALLATQRPEWSLERSFYTDSAIFDADLDRIFNRGWLCAGHTCRIPNPGDYFTYAVGNESIILIRDPEEGVQALFNVCRHRGSRVCTQPSGNARKLVCPYHQWVYNSNGSLLKARHMPKEFDRANFGLHRAHCRIAEGLIFICLAERPPDFALFERDITPRMKPHGLEQAKICHSRQYEVQANWKLIVENSRECYHCGPGHPQYCRAVGFAAAIDSPRAAEEDSLISQDRREHLDRLGIDSSPVPFLPDRWCHSRRFFLRDRFITESMDGKSVAPLMGSLTDRNVGVLAVVGLPNLLLEVSGDYAMLMRISPVSAVGTRIEMDWLVHPEAIEGRDYDVERVTAFWRLTAEQDWKLCEDNQLGVNSRRYQPGPYAPDERGVKHFVQWYLRLNPSGLKGHPDDQVDAGHSPPA